MANNGSIDVGEWKEISASKNNPGIPPLGSNAYSCPCTNCKAILKKTSQWTSASKEDEGETHAIVRIGDRVLVHSSLPGVVRYVGDLDSEYTNDQIYVGVKLDDPVGEHDGMYRDKRYFKCPNKHGMIVPMETVHILVTTDGRVLNIASCANGHGNRPLSTPTLTEGKNSVTSGITVSSTCPCFTNDAPKDKEEGVKTPAPSTATISAGAPASPTLLHAAGSETVAAKPTDSIISSSSSAKAGVGAMVTKSAPSMAESMRSSWGVGLSRRSASAARSGSLQSDSSLKWVNSAPVAVATSNAQPNSSAVRLTRSGIVKGGCVGSVPNLCRTVEPSRGNSLATNPSTGSRCSLKAKMVSSPLTVSMTMGDSPRGRGGNGEAERKEEVEESYELEDIMGPPAQHQEKAVKEEGGYKADRGNHDNLPQHVPMLAFVPESVAAFVKGAADNISGGEIVPMRSFTSRLYSSLPLKEAVTPPSPPTQLADVQQFALWVQVWGGGVRAWAMASTLQKLKHAQRKGEKEVQWQKNVFTLENDDAHTARIHRINILRSEISRVRSAREAVEVEMREKTFSNTQRRQRIEALQRAIQVEEERYNELMSQLEGYGMAHLARHVNELLARNEL